jgi:hypothetical protein
MALTIEELSVSIGAELSKLDKGLRDANTKLDKFSKEVNRKAKQSEDAFKGVGETLGAIFAIDQIKNFTGEMLRLTGQTQKFEAVLGNTLGSDSAAARGMGQIQILAAKTNYSVTELTENYVRLANQGFKPTSAELMKLADLANSTGKQFTQLTEAILDAQVGEFERLKEFGIRASKSGDQVKFTFKGVTTEVQNTEASIRSYILGLGDLNGVQGATAKIAETLEGQLSNLGDAWEGLMTTIGKNSAPAFSLAISGLQNLLANVREMFETFDDKGRRLGADFADDLVQKVEARLRKAKAEGDAAQKRNPMVMGAAGSVPGQANRERERLDQLYQKYDMERQRLEEMQTSNPLRRMGLGTEADQRIAQKIELATAKAWAYKNALDQVDQIQAKVMAGDGNTNPPALGLLESLQKRAKDLKDQMEKAPTAGLVDSLAGQLEKVNFQIKALLESNELERVYIQLDELYSTFADPTATDAALNNAKSRIDALEKERDAMEEVNDANLRMLMGYQKQEKELNSIKARQQTGAESLGTGGASVKMLERISNQKEIKVQGSGVDGALTPEGMTAEEFAQQYKEAGGTVVEVNSLIQSAMTDMIASAAFAFGQMAAGVGGMENIFSVLLGQISSFLSSFGKAMIAAGTAGIAAQAMLTNPWAALAAGTLLMAAAGAASAAAGTFASDMGAGKTGRGGQRGGRIPQYETGTNYVPSNQLAFLHKGEAVVPAKFNPGVFGGMAQKAIKLVGEFVARGRDLRLVLDQDNYTQMRTSG